MKKAAGFASVLPFLAAVAAVPAAAESASPSQRGAAADSARATDIPQTCQAAIDLVLDNLDDGSRALLRDTERERLQQYSRSWGRGIRQEFGLSGGNFALLDSCHARVPEQPYHPETASTVIMEAVWEALQRKH